MSGTALATTVLWRRRSRRLLLEVPAFTAAAAVVLFFLIFPFKRPLDAAGFLHAAAFDRVAQIAVAADPPPGSFVVDILDDVPLAPPPEPGRLPTDSELITTVQLVVTDDLPAYRSRVLGDNLVGPARDGGAIIDVETALRLGVKPGDSVVLALSLLTGDQAPVVEIGGLSQPFVSWTAPGHTGLFVVDRAALPISVVDRIQHPDGLAEGANHRLAFDGEIPADGSRSAAELRDGALLTALSQGQLIPSLAIIAFSALLWLAVTSRVAYQTTNSLLPAAALLSALGARPSRVARGVVIPFGLAALGGGILALAIVALVIEPAVMGWTIGLPLLLLLAAFGASSVLIVAVVVHRGVIALIRSERAMATLTRPEVD